MKKLLLIILVFTHSFAQAKTNCHSVIANFVQSPSIDNFPKSEQCTESQNQLFNIFGVLFYQSQLEKQQNKITFLTKKAESSLAKAELLLIQYMKLSQKESVLKNSQQISEINLNILTIEYELMTKYYPKANKTITQMIKYFSNVNQNKINENIQTRYLDEKQSKKITSILKNFSLPKYIKLQRKFQDINLNFSDRVNVIESKIKNKLERQKVNQKQQADSKA